MSTLPGERIGQMSPSVETLHAALNSIPADDRETWVRMGMAIKSELDEAGFELWDTWSQQAQSYKESDARAVWRSVRPNGGITVASLYHKARQHGWQGKSKSAPEINQAAQEKRAARVALDETLRQLCVDEAIRAASKMVSEAKLTYHPYLADKGLSGVRTLVFKGDITLPKRSDKSGFLAGRSTLKFTDAIIVPVRSLADSSLMGVQVIRSAGPKLFLPGSRITGGVHRLGRHVIRWYCEGYATGLSVQAALGWLYRRDEVVVCFSAANLARVAGRRGYVIADNDANGKGEKYARKTGLPYWMPTEAGTDANDFYQRYGVRALASELREVLMRRS